VRHDDAGSSIARHSHTHCRASRLRNGKETNKSKHKSKYYITGRTASPSLLHLNLSTLVCRSSNRGTTRPSLIAKYSVTPSANQYFCYSYQIGRILSSPINVLTMGRRNIVCSSQRIDVKAEGSGVEIQYVERQSNTLRRCAFF